MVFWESFEKSVKNVDRIELFLSWILSLKRVVSQTFFSIFLDFSKNYGIIPTCWLKNQQREHQKMQVIATAVAQIKLN
jgi:hypothetical protein